MEGPGTEGHDAGASRAEFDPFASDPELRQRAIRLFEYLQAVHSSGQPTIRNIAEYKDKLWWAADVPDHPSCVVTITGVEPWLRVSKPTLPDHPTLPDDLKNEHLAAGVVDPTVEPALHADLAERLALDEDEVERLHGLLATFVENQWRAGAKLAKVALSARALYQDLYDLRLRLQRDDAFIELAWGTGVLSWLVNGERIVHPMVTTRVRIEFDPDTGAVSIHPDSLISNLEIELLQGLGLNGFDLLVDLRNRFRQEPAGPFDPALASLYNQLLAPLGLDGNVREEPEPERPTDHPVITATWGLFVRRRSTLYQRFFSNLRDALASNEIDVPHPLASVVADAPSDLEAAGAGLNEAEWGRVGELLLMPLPSNPEQEAVAQRLSYHRGVTVQGPPGTGKTHTIANLISHLVGHGKSVLVTSQKDQALRVLRAKIPEEVRDLTIEVLDSSAGSLAQLEVSVQAIYEHAVGLDRAIARAQLAAVDQELRRSREAVASLRSRIEAVSARERGQYSVGSASYTPSTLGTWLADRANALAFIPDSLASTTPCPLSPRELVTLYEHAAQLDPADCIQVRLTLPDPSLLPKGADLATKFDELRDLRTRLADLEAIVDQREGLDELGFDGLTRLLGYVRGVRSYVDAVTSTWLGTIISECRSDQALADGWRAQAKALTETVDELNAWRQALVGHVIVLPNEGLPSKASIEQLQALRDRMAAGKGVSRMLHRELHAVQQRCQVDEEAPRSSGDVELCLVEARARRREYELANRWNQTVGRVLGPRLEPGTPVAQLLGHVRDLKTAVDWASTGWTHLRQRLVMAGVSPPADPSPEHLATLEEGLIGAAAHFKERTVNADLASIRAQLVTGQTSANPSVLWSELVESFDASAIGRWNEGLGRARYLTSLVGAVAELDRLRADLAVAAPIWAHQILEHRANPDRVGPVASAVEAWTWRQGETWLQDLLAGDDPATLQRQLESELIAVQRSTAQLAAGSAWLALADRLTDQQRQALTAWAQALKKIGKGTGKRAPFWRAVAQKAMGDAQSAVPVWIMPTHRVVEAFDPATTMFDVVIVDESSQCDLYSLAALGIARKVVIVGDDKQISPRAVGVDQGQIHELISQHIPDLPHSSLLDVTSSLYDIGKRTYSGVIMLKEHFRCVPEIIDFSNHLSYDGQILPLREQPLEADWPAVVDAHVMHGYREAGTDTNPPEAEYIVNTIVELCADTRYDRKTFGVVTLLGLGQAELIERMLINKLGERELEKRRIKCGNAYHFQGDERDVMFLSLVVSSGEGRRVGAKTRESDRQEINVAASRARDQMFCVRSISPDELHIDDVRGRFIRYCQDPSRVEDVGGDLFAKCDSDFERDVLRELLQRGFNVLVQHRVGRFRIDLVVVGRGGRLAIELDGDAFHGPDRWGADRNRQAILERLGWRFHRIRGSKYYRTKDEALKALWDRLERENIWPPREDPAPPPIQTLPPAPVFPTRSTPATFEEDEDDVVDVQEAASLRVAPVSPRPGPVVRTEPATRPLTATAVTRADVPRPAPSTSISVPPSPRSPASETFTPNASSGGVQPFLAWQPHAVPTVEAASPRDIAAGLVAIVSGEGPMVASRAYELYVKASGGSRVGKNIRTALNRVLAQAVRDGVIAQIDDGEPGQLRKTIYLPGTASVVVRTGGGRDLEDVPFTEVVALIQTLRAARPLADEPLKRAILDVFERSRLTAQASSFLDRCIAFADL